MSCGLAYGTQSILDQLYVTNSSDQRNVQNLLQENLEAKRFSEPRSFGIANQNGLDAAVLVQYCTNSYPGEIILSIDGVKAFDHISAVIA
eukprot:8761721-Pyramimonas_sp.AAC.1